MEYENFQMLTTDAHFTAASVFGLIIVPNRFLFELPSKLPFVGKFGFLLSLCLYPGIVALQFMLCLIGSLIRILNSTGTLFGNVQILSVFPALLLAVWYFLSLPGVGVLDTP